MILSFAAALMTLAIGEAVPHGWACSNDIEVWCSQEGCAAKPREEVTPMAITASPAGHLSICAYTGCWEGEAARAQLKGRLIWAADHLVWSSSQGGELTANGSLVIIEEKGVGFVEVGGIATPLLCRPAETKQPDRG